jgi:hypothetical protein
VCSQSSSDSASTIRPTCTKADQRHGRADDRDDVIGHQRSDRGHDRAEAQHRRGPRLDRVSAVEPSRQEQHPNGERERPGCRVGTRSGSGLPPDEALDGDEEEVRLLRDPGSAEDEPGKPFELTVARHRPRAVTKLGLYVERPQCGRFRLKRSANSTDNQLRADRGQPQ